MITRQDSQAPGVLRQRLGDAELGAEVGDRRWSATFYLRSPSLVPPWLTEIDREILDRALNLVHEGVVGGKGPELVSRERGQHGGGVLANRGPAHRVDLGEKVPR